MNSLRNKLWDNIEYKLKYPFVKKQGDTIDVDRLYIPQFGVKQRKVMDYFRSLYNRIIDRDTNNRQGRLLSMVSGDITKIDELVAKIDELKTKVENNPESEQKSDFNNSQKEETISSFIKFISSVPSNDELFGVNIFNKMCENKLVYYLENGTDWDITGVKNKILRNDDSNVVYGELDSEDMEEVVALFFTSMQECLQKRTTNK